MRIPEKFDRISIWIFLGALWSWLFLCVSPVWKTGRYYEFGYLVPFLLAFLVFQRRGLSKGVRFRQLSILGWGGIGLLAIPITTLAYLSIGISDWRLVFGLQGILTASLTLWILAWTGGVRYALGFLGIILLGLTAVPWPINLEGQVVDRFTKLVVDFNVSILPYFGIPGEKVGNVIMAGTQRVEVAEACSGIKSLQMLLALALFVGESGFLSLGRRAFLLASALPLAFVFNTMRTLALSYGSFKLGEGWYENWHDTLGFVSFGCSGGSLLLLGQLLIHRGRLTLKGSYAKPPSTIQSGGVLMGLNVAGFIWVFLLVSAGLMSRMISWWDNDAVFASRVRLPDNWESRLQVMDDEAQQQLSCIDSQVQTFLLPGGSAQVYFLEWSNLFAGYRDVTIHRPDICLGYYGGAKEKAKPMLQAMESTAGQRQVFQFSQSASQRSMRLYRILGTLNENGELNLGDWAVATSSEATNRFSYRRMVDLAFHKSKLRQRFFMILISVEGNVTATEADNLAEDVFRIAQSSIRPVE